MNQHLLRLISTLLLCLLAACGEKPKAEKPKKEQPAPAETAEPETEKAAETPKAEPKSEPKVSKQAPDTGTRSRAPATATKEEAHPMGVPFSEFKLLQEINVATAKPLKQDPGDASEVQTILGKKARVLKKTKGEAALFSYRIGRGKGLVAGKAYVLEIEYPEDKPRSWIVRSTANELSKGFHTGSTFGDALHPKYVNNLCENVDTPLSGKYESWVSYFHMHDMTHNGTFIRADNNGREFTPDDGFIVTIAQFAAKNIPGSAGAAVSAIRLYEVPDPKKLHAQYRMPEGLPHRHIFWREEMSDGVLSKNKKGPAGLKDPIDWFRFKRNRMQFLGINTYSKDLLEFGACQHWDSREYGGNNWVYFADNAKHWWGEIVKVMGDAGFYVLPYYEYTGSKGQNGLGNKKRAEPLVSTKGYSHTKWIESHNVDLTDPDAYEDFKKMLDLTVIRHTDKAKFVGAWMRQRGGMVMSFSEDTRKRFGKEANHGKTPSKKDLINNANLLAKYKDWWYKKRRDFNIAMRNHMRDKGVDDALLLYTADAGEPGVGFKGWGQPIVTDDKARWNKIFAEPLYKNAKGEALSTTSIEEVVSSHRYLEGLKSESNNWGGWELHHRTPPNDPQNYSMGEGVMLSHAFNYVYTVSDPKSFDEFRNKEGLCLVRHYTLNEHMDFGKDGKTPKTGYFVADFERNGPYCMMSEAIAMANGDPTHIGYLAASNYSRGFPYYARKFNTAFLSLPALPSKKLSNASSNKGVVVREIKTKGKGTYYAIVSTSKQKEKVTVTLPAKGKTIYADSGEAAPAKSGKLSLELYPFQLVSLHVK